MTTGTGALTDEEREALLAVARAATSGPWFVYDGEPWSGDEAAIRSYDAASAAGEPINEQAWDAVLRDAGSLFLGDAVHERDAVFVATFDPPTIMRLLDLAARAGGQQTQAEAALDEARVMNRALYSASWEIFRGAGLLPPPQGVHPAVTWLRDRADALTAALPERAPTQAEQAVEPITVTEWGVLMAGEDKPEDIVEDRSTAEFIVDDTRDRIKKWEWDPEDYEPMVIVSRQRTTWPERTTAWTPVALDGPDTEEQR